MIVALPPALYAPVQETGISLAQIQEKIDGWQRRYPGLVRLEALPGKTREGRPIPVVRIGKPGTPEIALMAGIHPREQQPPLYLLRLIDELLVGYEKGDRKATQLLDTRTIFVIPLFNIDGKLWEEGHRDWRKNRSPNADGTFGVDLNRNFRVRWGGSRELDTTWNDTTARTGADIYEGPTALSEPENQALDGFFSAHPNLRAFLDIHSPLREILWPAHTITPEYFRFARVGVAMQQLQDGDPYPVTKATPGSEPQVGARGGNSGLTYTHAYYLHGIYGFNFEISNPSKDKGIKGRYPEAPAVEKEYETHVKAPWLAFIDLTADLPARQEGSVRVSGPGTTTAPLKPGALVGWTPGELVGPCDYAVLISESPAIVVPSEYRNLPLKTPFTVQVMPEAKPGTVVPMALYIWDREHRRTIHRFTLTVGAE